MIGLIWNYGWAAVICAAGAALFAAGAFGRLGAVVFPPLATVPAVAFVAARWGGALLGAYGLLLIHDAGLEAGWVAQQRAAVAEAQDAARQAGDAAVAAQKAETAKRDADIASLRKEIADAADTKVCADTGLARDILDGLYRDGAGRR